MLFAGLSKFIQMFLDIIVSTINLLFSFFPPSPFTFLSPNSQFADFIAQINYFVPIYEFVTITESWLISVAFYYVYSIWARWVKAIE